MGKKKRAVVKRPMTKKQRSRAEREKRINRWIIIGTATVAVIVVGILAFGLIKEVVIAGREPVAVVNGVPIRTADFQARVRFSYYQMIDYGLGEQLATYQTFLAQQVLDQMADEELLRQEAARRRITVSQEEIDRSIEMQYFGYDRDAAAALPSTTLTATQTTTPTTREEFEERYQTWLDTVLEPSKLGMERFRAMVEANLLGQQIYDQFGEEVPATMVQVQVRYVSFETAEQAAQMVERLDAGESWDDIVAEFEDDDTVVVLDNPVYWTEGYATDQFGAELAAAAFATPGGGYTGPVTGSNGRAYVLYVLENGESELSSLMRSYEQNRLFEEWMEAQRALVEYSENWQDKVPPLP